MIQITLALPDGRNTYMTASSTTIKDFLDENHVNYARATVMVDGMAMTPENMRKSFADHGINDECTIAICAKLQNA